MRKLLEMCASAMNRVAGRLLNPQGSVSVIAPLPAGSAVTEKRDTGAHAHVPPFHLDVRPALAEGREPLEDILALARRVPDDGTMILDAPFNPIPLRRMLNEAGFADAAEQLAPAHWRITFRRAREPFVQSAGEPHVWHADATIHIDVRGLPAPKPMIEILKLVDSCPAVTTIMVHHDREPEFLYPELAQRRWGHQVVTRGADEIVIALNREALT